MINREKLRTEREKNISGEYNVKKAFVLVELIATKRVGENENLREKNIFFLTLKQSSDDEPHSFQLKQKVRLFDYRNWMCVCYDEESEEKEKISRRNQTNE